VRILIGARRKVLILKNVENRRKEEEKREGGVFAKNDQVNSQDWRGDMKAVEWEKLKHSGRKSRERKKRGGGNCEGRVEKEWELWERRRVNG